MTSPREEPEASPNAKEQPSRWGTFVRKALLPAGILSVGLAGYFLLQALGESPERRESEELPPLVRVQTLGVPASPAGNEPLFHIAVDGVVVPHREVSVAAEVAGRVTDKTKYFEAGYFVERGTPLAEIEPKTYELEVDRVVSERQQVEIDLAQLEVEARNHASLKEIAEIELSLAKRNWERAKELARRGSATESDVEDAERAVRKAENAVRTHQNALELIPKQRDRLEAQKKLAEARLEQAQLNLRKTSISAPIAGVISEELVERDDYVAQGATLLKIEDTSAVEVKISLRIDDLNWLWQARGEEPRAEPAPGVPYHVVPETPAKVVYTIGANEHVWQGKLYRHDGAGLDEATRTVPCRVLVDDPRGQAAPGGPPTLVRGMFVKVLLEVGRPPHRPLRRIPAEALHPPGPGERDPAMWRVFTVEDSGGSGEPYPRLRTHSLRVVRRLRETGDVLADLSSAPGLHSGARLLVSPLTEALERRLTAGPTRESVPVRVVEVPNGPK